MFSLEAELKSPGDCDLSTLGKEPLSRDEAIASVDGFLDECIELLRAEPPVNYMAIYVRAETYAILLKSDD
jgi:hypothetical protein